MTLQTLPPLRTDTPSIAPYGDERDACALLMCVNKHGDPNYATLKRAIDALGHMQHRTGFIEGEGDGSGIQTDIPRAIWSNTLAANGFDGKLAEQSNFWVGHCFVPMEADFSSFRDELTAYFNERELDVLLTQQGRTMPEVLGPRARRQMPTFWQIAGLADGEHVETRLLEVVTDLEGRLPIHFASLSTHNVVYKVQGSVDTLVRFYPDLQDREFQTAFALCHSRYSTNTATNFFRAQPFMMMGHNGEINTITRFREQAAQLNVRLPKGGSDSQDVDRTMHTMIVKYGLDVIEAMEYIFPPVPHELERLPQDLQQIYTQVRQAYGPYAQGPAAVVARFDNFAVASVDALGLRPLWFVETHHEYVLSSERGAIPLEDVVDEPRALAPGEKIAIKVHQGEKANVLEHRDIRRHVQRRAQEGHSLAQTSIPVTDWPGQPDAGEALNDRTQPKVPRSDKPQGGRQAPLTATQTKVVVATTAPPTDSPWRVPADQYVVDTAVLAAAGWQREHIRELDTMKDIGKEVVGSLGHDGPLAVLSKNRVNVADFFKETVAVVTNPAIDRVRESEAFSTERVVGARPMIGMQADLDDIIVQLDTPLLTGGHAMLGGPEVEAYLAKELGTMPIDELVATFGNKVAYLTMGVYEGESVQEALERIGQDAIDSVRAGVQCLILDDTETVRDGLGWVDPHLATSYVDKVLREAGDARNLRRRAGIVVRSAGLRTLHDLILLCGLGADAINPYAMMLAALNAHKRITEDEQEIVAFQKQVLKAMTAGFEKVTSTMGCHELRGYGRVFSSIGIAPSVAEILGAPNFLGVEHVGLNWERFDEEANQRQSELNGEEKRPRLASVDRFYPKWWKKVENYAMGEMELDELLEIFDGLQEKVPVALRHILGFNIPEESDVKPEDVDITIGDHDMPFVIGAMSFGSQGELSYRAYANAAPVLNIMTVNGEGGEINDMLQRLNPHRGQQVASGRFGVNAEFLNSCKVIEIKIGQGAKPGEGGMLPAYKVTEQIAAARRTNPHVPLISPSNNHDLYSIEDLAELIEELKIVNTEAKVSVKLPVVPNIGVIAVGVAKAGADIINLTGYDGGTGAARKHALQYVGLPAEVGVVQAHRALIESGLREQVEVWCDGGMKTGSDAVKMMLLGANRVGYGTMAMVSIGCTICRKCNEGTCHVGITTHIKTVEEADKLGLPSFVPRDYDQSLHGIIRVFNGLAHEVREIVAALGFTNAQDIVGRADLLKQVRLHDKIDLSAIFYPVEPLGQNLPDADLECCITRPSTHLTKLVTESVIKAVKRDQSEVTYRDNVMGSDRMLGAHLAGALERDPEVAEKAGQLSLRFGPSSVAGHGFGAFNTEKLDLVVEGGAQDGVAKSANGGRVAIMKGLNSEGKRIDGNVGKSFAYGAQRGVLIVQGGADSRACIRFSGADAIFGGEITEPINDTESSIGTHANLKGYACEYMTSGRVLIMGDPGPYAFAGMSGGVVYQKLTPHFGFDRVALERRIAQNAQVAINSIDDNDVVEIQKLLQQYIRALNESHQPQEAARIQELVEDENNMKRLFVKVVANLH